MAEDNSDAGTVDAERIDTRDDYELRTWARRFGVTLDDVRDAVMTVGNSADAVKRHLGK